MGESRKACIFWDGSNIFVPARQLAVDKEGPYHAPSVRIQIDNLFELARAGRELERSVYVSSVSSTHPILDILRSCGMAVETFEVGEWSGKEQAVDQALQVHMLRALADLPPGVAVLLAGDGAGSAEGRGYFADLKRMHAKGWQIEVVAWKAACHRGLRRWAEEVGVFVALDDFYDSVTFLEGVRRSRPLPAAALQRKRLTVKTQPAGACVGAVAPAPSPAAAVPDVRADSIEVRPMAPVVLPVQVSASRGPSVAKRRYKSRTTVPAVRRAEARALGPEQGRLDVEAPAAVDQRPGGALGAIARLLGRMCLGDETSENRS